MQVILLSRIRNLGDLGDTVKVRAGYGRNYLIPQGLALPANKDNVATFEARRADLIKAAQDSLNAAKMRHKDIDGKTVTVKALASDEGKLYGSVTAANIADAAQAAGIAFEAKEVQLDHALRDVGEFPATIALHPDLEASITVAIVSEKAN
ncbi:MAG: 50S ribosomal protein L9 [Oceanococcaceae bacterium]